MNLNHQQKKGIIGLVVFYTITLLILILFGFSTPLPLPEEEGILIDFGDSKTGWGKVEPIKPKVTPKPKPTPKPVVKEESNLTQDYEESVQTVPEKKIEKKEKKIKKEEPKKEVVKEEVKQEEPKEEEPVIDPNALFTNNANTSQQSSNSEGIAGGEGNQGREDGNPNSNQYTGHGSGNNGVGYSLAGRKPKGLPKPTYNSNEQGRVVVKIVVDRNGKVISAIPGVKGSTTLDSSLLQAAKKAALSTTFDKKTSAPSKQTGTITYDFVLK